MRRKMREQIVWKSALFACLSLGGAVITMAQNEAGHLRSVQASASLQQVGVPRPSANLPLGSTRPSWMLLPGNGPVTARIATPAVFDLATNQMIIFGGLDERGSLNDVEALTNANGLGGAADWVSLIANAVPGSPPSRSSHSAVYDETNSRLVVFAGCTSTPGPDGVCMLPALNDVWVLTNANGLGGIPTWIQLFPAGGPPAGRVGHTAVYDSGTNSMITFAGNDGTFQTGGNFSDVWVLSNANGLGGTPTWTQIFPTGGPPQGKLAASAVYNPTSNIMTVFAGLVDQNQSIFTNGVWTLSHANGRGGTPAWTNLVADGAPGSPMKRFFSSAVYDTVGNRMTIFGGAVSGVSFVASNDVWVLSNADGLGGTPVWTRLNPKGARPVERGQHAAAYDATNNRMMIFGGSGPEGIFFSTWVLTNANGHEPDDEEEQ